MSVDCIEKSIGLEIADKNNDTVVRIVIFMFELLDVFQVDRWDLRSQPGNRIMVRILGKANECLFSNIALTGLLSNLFFLSSSRTLCSLKIS